MIHHGLIRSGPGHSVGKRDALLISLSAFLLAPGGAAFPQSTPQPTSPPSLNSIDSANGEYYFRSGGQTLYWYSPATGSDYLRTGGTLHAIRALTYDGRTDFIPSNAGGPRVEFAQGVEKYPYDPGVTFSRTLLSRDADTLITRWKMSYRGSDFQYQYRLHIAGRTLVVRVKALGGSVDYPTAGGFTFDRCERALNPGIVKIPFLTLFNLLCSNESFVSLFFDWELTHCSRYEPGPETRDRTSARFAPVLTYTKKTDGLRNPLEETIYLTVSPDLNGALPNLPGPAAPLKARSADRTVLSYNQPFPWLLYPPGPPFYSPPYNYIDSISRLGIRNVALIIKNWQQGQFDHKLPSVLPPSQFDTDVCGGPPPGGHGGMENLVKLRKKIVDTLHYDFALHENYTDYYTDAFSTQFDDPRYRYSEESEAKLPDGSFVRGWCRNCSGDSAHIIKPSKAKDFLRYWAGNIRASIAPNWSYLDVHSSVNPSGFEDIRSGTYIFGWVDYDAGEKNPGRDSAGMFLYTIRKYRELPEILRNLYGGPVEGEGGNHFLYAGYFDDFEGRIQTADWNVQAVRAPLLVDFDLYRMHAKSAQHGVGHIREFLMLPGSYRGLVDTSHRMIQRYVATELAFGHGGLVTKGYNYDHSIYQSWLEFKHVLPMQQSYINANPDTIAYYDQSGTGPVSASAYIRDHKRYWDSTSAEFMARVKVVYDNGVIVCVNRSSLPWKDVTVGERNGWFTQNTIGVDTPQCGFPDTNRFTLKPYGGWVCYNPLLPRPTSPSLLLPSSNDTTVSTAPRLSWRSSDGAVSYNLQVSTSRTFSTTTLDKKGITALYRDMPRLATRKRYYWRVRAEGKYGSSAWSSPRSFTTK